MDLGPFNYCIFRSFLLVGLLQDVEDVWLYREIEWGWLRMVLAGGVCVSAISGDGLRSTVMRYDLQYMMCGHPLRKHEIRWKAFKQDSTLPFGRLKEADQSSRTPEPQ